MKNVKKVVALFLAMLMIITLVACLPKKTESPDEPPISSDTKPGVSEETKTIEITDVMGRKVILDKPATRIIGTHNPTLNAAVVLGGGQKYIAGFGFAPKGMGQELYSLVMDDYDGLIQVGTGTSINLETAVSVNPDLAIIPERFKDTYEEFEKMDIPTLTIIPANESLDAVKTTLTILGKALGEDKRASEINEFFDKKIANAQIISTKAKTKQKVLFLGGRSPLTVAPSAMIQSQLIEAAGGENAVSNINIEGGFMDVNIEQIIAWNPDVIWFPAYGSYTIESLLNDPAWSGINAIKNKAVHIFPSKLEPWDYPTAAVALGVCWATHNLHPDLYSLDDLKKDADEFYNLVYGRTFTLEQFGLE